MENQIQLNAFVEENYENVEFRLFYRLINS